MKKIFTLLLTVSLVSSAFAQYSEKREGYENRNGAPNGYHRDWDGNDRYNKRHYNFSRREMEMQIADINREYENRICRVKDNWFMSPFRKQRIIKELESRRRDEIQAVYAKFNDRRNMSDDCGPVRHW
nr:hypothetical protein [uncultured bacterium]